MPVVDFAPALYKGKNPAWHAETQVFLGDVIEPKRNNDAGFELFQAVPAGTTGKEEPFWTSTVEPYRSRNHTPLPLPRWPGANRTVDPEFKIQPLLGGNKGEFIFKSSGTGRTGETEPVWFQTPACQVKDGSVVWSNMNATSTIAALQNQAELKASYPFFEEKIRLLAIFADRRISGREIPDPYYGDTAATRNCCAVLANCVQNLVEKLELTRS